MGWYLRLGSSSGVGLRGLEFRAVQCKCLVSGSGLQGEDSSLQTRNKSEGLGFSMAWDILRA